MRREQQLYDRRMRMVAVTPIDHRGRIQQQISGKRLGIFIGAATFQPDDTAFP
jgi:hypothetical protein